MRITVTEYRLKIWSATISGDQCEGQNSPAAEIAWNRPRRPDLIRRRNEKCAVLLRPIKVVDSFAFNLDLAILRQALEKLDDGGGNYNTHCEPHEACEYRPELSAPFDTHQFRSK